MPNFAIANPGTLGSSLQVFLDLLRHFFFHTYIYKNNYKGRLKGGDVKYILLMTREDWLAMHEEWLNRISTKRADRNEATQLESLDLEIIDVKTKNSGIGLPVNSCSLSLRGGKRLTLNKEHSKMVAKKLSTHINNAELASHLIDLLDLDPAKEYFLLDIELLAETKDYLLFMIKNKGKR